MADAQFHSAGWLDIEMFINRFRVQRFVFTADSIAFNITDFTWQLVIKDNPGARKNVLSLTLGNGLSFPIYDENVIEARFESVDTNIKEGQYFWQLIRTDTDEPWINGWAEFSYGPLGSATEQEVTVSLVNETININLQSIVYVTDLSSILTLKKTITSSEILNSFISPVTIIPAVADKIIVPVMISHKITFNSVAYATNVSTIYSINGNQVFTPPHDISFTQDKFRVLYNSAASINGALSNLINKPLLFSTSVGNPTAGNSDIEVEVLYYLQ